MSERDGEYARILLHHLVRVGEWIKSGDEQAKPYIDADAVRVDSEGDVSYHRERFLAVYMGQMLV